MNKAYRYRIYPDKDQIQLFMKTFGCCRKVWNLMLADKMASYAKDGTFAPVTPAMYKDDYPYLREVDSLALANTQLDLQRAIRDAKRVKGRGFPKWKSRHNSRMSYTTNAQHGTVRVTDRGIRLPKAGMVKAKIHRRAPEGWSLKAATVSMESDGSWYCSVLYEYEEPAAPADPAGLNAVGIDYASDGLGVLSDGTVIGSPKKTRAYAKKLARAQKSLSRKQGSRKGEAKSSNWKKQSRRVNRIHRKIANSRKDHLHKASLAIAKRYDLVGVEGLNMRAMSNKGFGNGKATMDNGYGMFLSFLEYKLRDRGGQLIRIDKWYPSSQICHVCGTRAPELKELKIRHWTCRCCGESHDRDVNAAINIRDEAVRVYKELMAV